MTIHNPDTFKTPTQVQAERIADLEARLQLANEAYFYSLAENRRLVTELEMIKRKENHP